MTSAPATADEAAAKIPWPGFTSTTEPPIHPQLPVPGLRAARIEIAHDERSGRLRPHGLFFRAADGIEIGAIGGLDPQQGGFRAILAIRLAF